MYLSVINWLKYRNRQISNTSRMLNSNLPWKIIIAITQNITMVKMGTLIAISDLVSLSRTHPQISCNVLFRHAAVFIFQNMYSRTRSKYRSRWSWNPQTRKITEFEHNDYIINKLWNKCLTSQWNTSEMKRRCRYTHDRKLIARFASDFVIHFSRFREWHFFSSAESALF